MIDTERERFEAACEEADMCTDLNSRGRYAFTATSSAWFGWQAARSESAAEIARLRADRLEGMVRAVATGMYAYTGLGFDRRHTIAEARALLAELDKEQL